MSVKVVFKSMPVFALPDFRFSPEVLEAMDLFIHLLRPASILAFALASWRLGADIGWTSDFLIVDGIFSRWQIWAVLGIAMFVAESCMARRSNRV